MTFPVEHNASGLKVISTNDGSLLITGSLNREDGFFGEFKPNSTAFPSSISPGTNVERSKFVALYDEEGKVKWIKDLYDEFNIKEPLVHLQKDGTSKIVHQLSGSENIGGFSVTSVDQVDAYIAEIDADGNLAKAQTIRATNSYPAPSLIFAPDNSYYSLSGYLDEDDQDIVLRKFSHDHELQWQKTGESLGLSTIISHESDNTAAFTQADNSLTFEQYKYSRLGNPSARYLGRISSEGNPEWKIEIDHRIGSISPSNDGGAIFLQTDYASDGADESIVKIDSSGNTLWTSSFAREDSDGYFEIEEKPNGNIIVAGEFDGEATFGQNLKLTADDGATFVAKLDSHGIFTQARKLGSEGWGTVTGLANLSNGDSIISRNPQQNPLPTSLVKFDRDLIEIEDLKESQISLEPSGQIEGDDLQATGESQDQSTALSSSPQEPVSQSSEDSLQVNDESQEKPANTLTKPQKYKKKFADKIINFNPSADTLEVDIESFGIVKSPTFAGAKNKKIIKRQFSRFDIDFLYDQKKGGLYFNENGLGKGFGDGGIIAIFKGAPDLTVDNLEFI